MPSAIDPDEFLLRLAATRRAIASKLAGTAAGRRADRLLRRLEGHLARPVRVIVLGETNSGKTTIVNAVLGDDLLAADVIQNTRAAVLVRHAPRPSLALVMPDGRRQPIERGSIHGLVIASGATIEVGVPLPRLQQSGGVEIIDTPGLDIDAMEHDGEPGARRTADIAIWCTIATQAWRASEVAAWRSLRHPSATSLLVVTRADLLDETDRDKVLGRLKGEAGAAFAAIVMCQGPSAGTAIAPALDRVLLERRQARCRKVATIVRTAAEQLDATAQRSVDLTFVAARG